MKTLNRSISRRAFVTGGLFAAAAFPFIGHGRNAVGKATLALIGADVFLLRRLFPDQILWLALPGICFALWLMVCIWVFPLTAIFENSLGNTLKNAVLLSVGYLPRTILMALIHLLPVILFAVSPAAFYGVSILWLLLLSAVTYYTDLWLMQKPFAPFLTDETQ